MTDGARSMAGADTHAAPVAPSTSARRGANRRVDGDSCRAPGCDEPRHQITLSSGRVVRPRFCRRHNHRRASHDPSERPACSECGQPSTACWHQGRPDAEHQPLCYSHLMGALAIEEARVQGWPAPVLATRDRAEPDSEPTGPGARVRRGRRPQRAATAGA